MNMKFEHAPGGAMAIHAKVPNQLVFKADGTLESATKPDLGTASPETLATVGAVREMNRMPLFFQGIHNGTREGLQRVYKGCATPNDAIQISALTHPELVKGVLRGDVATCDEAAFQADPYQRGKWSRGTAYLDGAGKPQGWVRTPDLNQAMPDSLPPPFARGGADAKAGSIGKDTMRELSGELLHLAHGVALTTEGRGVFKFEGSSGSSGNAAGAGPTDKISFAASRSLPEGHTGTEFAPWHVYGVSYSITSNGVFNEGAIDAEQVMGEVLLNRGRIAALEAVQPEKRLRASGVIKGLMVPAQGFGLYGATVIDQGVGDYEVLLTQPAPNENYVIALATRPFEGGGFNNAVFFHAKTVNGFRVRATSSVSGYMAGDWTVNKVDQFETDFAVFY